MKMGRLSLLCAMMCLGGPVLAGLPDGTVRPQARSMTAEAAPPAITLSAIRPESRPAPAATEPDPALRPQARAPSQQVLVASSRSVVTATALAQSMRPFSRPPTLEQKAMSRRKQSRRGMVCNDPQIQGEVVGMVPGRISGCGIPDAVRIRSVSGIALSQQSLMDCTTAKALNRWVNNGVKPALRSKGQVEQLRVAAHYACRTRNNQPGARISEHGKGRAIDISGFKMADGEMITVREHWNARGYRHAMRKMHRTACGPFGTVLGPESDRFHRDHFHFDTAQYRSGPFCR